jgi:hypothetical protein
MTHHSQELVGLYLSVLMTLVQEALLCIVAWKRLKLSFPLSCDALTIPFDFNLDAEKVGSAHCAYCAL